MPLTPAEQAELQQLQAEAAPKASAGLSAAEQAELAQLNTETQHAPGFTEKHPVLSGLAHVASPALTVVAPIQDFQGATGRGEKALPAIGGIARSGFEHFVDKATGGYEPQIEGGIRALIGKGPYVNARDAARARLTNDVHEYPETANVGRTWGTIANAVGAGKLAGAATGAMGLGSTVLGPTAGTLAKIGAGSGRIAAGAVQGGLIGGTMNPGDTRGVVDPVQAGPRAGNAATGALIGGGASTAGEAINLGSHLLRKSGEALTGLKPNAAQAWIDNPQATRDIAHEYTTNPRGFEARVQGELQDAQGRLMAKTAPQRAKLEQLISSKNIQTKPEDFAGTAAGREIERVSKLVPDYVAPEAANPEAAQPPPYKDSFVQTLDKPARVALLGKQAWRAKAASQEAADIIEENTPIGVKPQNETELAAANRLQSALHGESQTRPIYKGPNYSDLTPKQRLAMAPEDQVPALDQELSEAARMSSRAGRLGNNPAGFITDSSAPGAVPKRSLADYLDAKTGSNFKQQADQLQAGRDMAAPIHGFWANMNRTTGQLPLWLSGMGDTATSAAQNSSPYAAPTLMQAFSRRDK